VNLFFDCIGFICENHNIQPTTLLCFNVMRIFAKRTPSNISIMYNKASPRHMQLSKNLLKIHDLSIWFFSLKIALKTHLSIVMQDT